MTTATSSATNYGSYHNRANNANILRGILANCPRPQPLLTKTPLSPHQAKPKDMEANLADLRRSLQNLNVLLSQGITKDTETQYLAILNHIAAINLPPEIKLKEAGYFSLSLQENVSNSLKESGPKTSVPHEVAMKADIQFSSHEAKIENLTKEELFDRMSSFGSDLEALEQRSAANFQDFLTGPLTPEKIEEFNKRNQEIIFELNSKTQTIVQNFEKHHENMTKEEEEQALAELQRIEEELRKQAAKHREEQAAYLAERNKYPVGSEEWIRYNELANGAGALANAYEQNATSIYQTIERCSSELHQQAEENETQVSTQKGLDGRGIVTEGNIGDASASVVRETTVDMTDLAGLDATETPTVASDHATAKTTNVEAFEFEGTLGDTRATAQVTDIEAFEFEETPTVASDRATAQTTNVEAFEFEEIPTVASDRATAQTTNIEEFELEETPTVTSDRATAQTTNDMRASADEIDLTEPEEPVVANSSRGLAEEIDLNVDNPTQMAYNGSTLRNTIARNGQSYGFNPTKTMNEPQHV